MNPLCSEADVGDPISFCSNDSDVERLFKRFFSEKSLFSAIPHHIWSPPTDVYETPDKYVVRIEIPGIQETDVTIELNQNVLTVRGYRRDRCSDTKLGFLQMEIHFGYFEKVVTLPHAINPNVLPAAYGGGFLVVAIAKAPPRRVVRHRIEIES